MMAHEILNYDGRTVSIRCHAFLASRKVLEPGTTLQEVPWAKSEWRRSYREMMEKTNGSYLYIVFWSYIGIMTKNM